MNAPQLSFHEVDRGRWPDLARLFDSRGGPKSCWCMVWRATPQEAKRKDGASRKAALQKRVCDGIPIGLIGYLHDEPVAWCSIAPRDTYRRLGGSDDDGPAARIWSLACFFLRRELRGQAVTAQMIEAAVGHARERGATVVEAYPVTPDSPSYRFMGFVPAFERAGFHAVGTAGKRRHIMRRELR
jgi:GNAT superfamily N-acetyltransferase